MTEQELSEAYSSLKERYWLMKKAVSIDWEELVHRYEILKDNYEKKEWLVQQLLKDNKELKEKLLDVKSVNSGNWVPQSTHMKAKEKIKELETELRVAIRNKDMSYMAYKAVQEKLINKDK